MAKFKKHGMLLVTLCCFICFTGCQQTTPKVTDNDLYISFTVTKDENDKLQMYNYTYDLETGKVEQKIKLSYYAQYPLTAYSKAENAVYYSYRNDGKTDQLHKISLDTKKVTTLTDSLFAINYIIPINHSLYLGAVAKGQRPIGFYKLEDKKLKRLLKDEDAFVTNISVNPILNKLAFNTYSQSEIDKNMEKNDYQGPYIESNTLYEVDLSTEKVMPIRDVGPNEISRLGLDYNGKIMYTLDTYYQADKNENKENLEFADVPMHEIIYLSRDTLYYIDTNNSIAKYDRTTKKSTELFRLTEEKAAINNAIILSKSSS